jgi:hypothetical protein
MDSFDKCFLRLFACWTCYFFYHSITWAYLVCVIWNSKSVQLILFKLCTVFIYILKMFTCYYTPTNKDWGYKGIKSICLSGHPDFVSRHISVYKNAYITGMSCSDAGPDTILVLFLNLLRYTETCLKCTFLMSKPNFKYSPTLNIWNISNLICLIKTPVYIPNGVLFRQVWL